MIQLSHKLISKIQPVVTSKVEKHRSEGKNVRRTLHSKKKRFVICSRILDINSAVKIPQTQGTMGVGR